jgi:adenylate kinase family enzyme
MERGIRVILLAGAGGAGKTSLAARIARQSGWLHISEDDFWVRIKEGHPRGELRTAQEQRVVLADVGRSLVAAVDDGKRVVLEFILYQDPPTPLLTYQRILSERSIPYITRVLRPTVEQLLQRIQGRGRDTHHDVLTLRANAEHQTTCLDSSAIRGEWRIDPRDKSIEDLYEHHFRTLVEGSGDTA